MLYTIKEDRQFTIISLPLLLVLIRPIGSFPISPKRNNGCYSLVVEQSPVGLLRIEEKVVRSYEWWEYLWFNGGENLRGNRVSQNSLMVKIFVQVSESLIIYGLIHDPYTPYIKINSGS